MLDWKRCFSAGFVKNGGKMAAGGGYRAVRPEVHFVVCTQDHNAIFSDEAMGSYYDELSETAKVTVSKVSSMMDFIRALIKSNKEADYLILAGHGSSEGISFAPGVDVGDVSLIKEHIHRRELRVVLLSCRTGKLGCESIGKRIADLGIEVLAPRGGSNLFNTEPNPLFGYYEEVFPINFTEGQVFHADGSTERLTGYETVDIRDIDLLSERMHETCIAYRAYRLYKIGKEECALELLTHLKKISRTYTENKLIFILHDLLRLKKYEAAKRVVSLVKERRNKSVIEKGILRLVFSKTFAGANWLRSLRDPKTIRV